MLTAEDSFGEISTSDSLFRFYLQGLTSGIQVTASLVSRSGQALDSKSGSSTISWPEDKQLLAALRRNAELVLTTGATARAENLRMPKSAKLAVISNSGDLSGTRLDPTDPNLMILSGHGDSSEYIDHLASLGYKRMHVEYGPSTMVRALGSGRIDLLVDSFIDKSFLDEFAPMAMFSLKLGPGFMRLVAFGVATD